MKENQSINQKHHRKISKAGHIYQVILNEKGGLLKRKS